MSEQQARSTIRETFERMRPLHQKIIEDFSQEAGAVLETAETIFEQMIPDMAYADNPDHPMAAAVFSCSSTLAVWQALRDKGTDVHRFGQAYLNWMHEVPPAPPSQDTDEDLSPREKFDAFIATSKSSQTDAKPGEFVVEAFRGDGKSIDWGMNITSCAICHAFGKHDAMDLVPYMCAYDDVASDREGQGLRRTGSIAVGAKQCDFRYKRGGEPKRLADLYPDKIHFTPID